MFEGITCPLTVPPQRKYGTMARSHDSGMGASSVTLGSWLSTVRPYMCICKIRSAPFMSCEVYKLFSLAML